MLKCGEDERMCHEKDAVDEKGVEVYIRTPGRVLRDAKIRPLRRSSLLP